MVGPDSRIARIKNAVILSTMIGLSLLAEGCSSSKSSGEKGKVEKGDATVTGKVTFQGKPVDGSIVFVGRHKDRASSALGPDGVYKIEDAPLGEVQVLVLGLPSPTNRPPPELAKLAKSNGGVAPPKKYETPNELNCTVTEGDQTKNFELTP